jgi:outer membrane protein
MKKTLFVMLTLVIMSVYAYSEIKIGVINAQEVFEKTKRGSKIQKELEAMNDKKAEELKALNESIKKLEKDLLSPALNSTAREQKSVELQTKRTDLQRRYEDAQRDLQRESQKKLLELEKELMPLITNLGKSKGFTIIFDRARSGIVYFEQSVDITNEVIAAIDAKLN